LLVLYFFPGVSDIAFQEHYTGSCRKGGHATVLIPIGKNDSESRHLGGFQKGKLVGE
jgi:hypothetical protein